MNIKNFRVVMQGKVSKNQVGDVSGEVSHLQGKAN